MKEQELVAPEEPKIWLFAWLLRVSEWPVLKQVKALIRLVFVELAPDIPVSLGRNFSGKAGKQAALSGFLVAFFFCFCVNALWTYGAGTFSGTDPGRLYFSDDWVNLILYTIVCPVYVGLGCWLAVTVVSGWGEINRLSEELAEGEAAPKQKIPGKAVLLAVLILGVAFVAISGYITDIMSVENVPEHYWFVEYSAETGRTLGPLGVYYFLLNFTLLVVTLISITLFMSVFSSMLDVGRALESREKVADLEFETLRVKLSSFTEGYLLAKWITVTYMVNVYLWERSPLGNTGNIYIAGFFLSLVGVVFVSLPRYFLELQWFRYRHRVEGGGGSPPAYEDTRPFSTKLIATVLDTLLIGGFITEFWRSVIFPGLSN